ncbi:hypothetical protein HaLaN_21313, partial [Haematococcus lacustris]
RHPRHSSLPQRHQNTQPAHYPHAGGKVCGRVLCHCIRLGGGKGGAIHPHRRHHWGRRVQPGQPQCDPVDWGQAAGSAQAPPGGLLQAA